MPSQDANGFGGRGAYRWVLSIDLDVALTAPRGDVGAWLRQRFGDAAALPCLVAGLDVAQEGVVNGGTMLLHNEARTHTLLRRWWSWPLEGADGAQDGRHRWDLGFWHEQSVLNVGILTDAALGSCVHIRPPGDFFAPPGTLLRHFTGMCSLHPPYDAQPQPAMSSAERKCKCFASHFGAARTMALLNAANATPLHRAACATVHTRDVRLPISENRPNGTIRVAYTQYTNCPERA